MHNSVITPGPVPRPRQGLLVQVQSGWISVHTIVCSLCLHHWLQLTTSSGGCPSVCLSVLQCMLQNYTHAITSFALLAYIKTFRRWQVLCGCLSWSALSLRDQECTCLPSNGHALLPCRHADIQEWQVYHVDFYLCAGCPAGDEDAA